jgi:plastocyanin
MPLSPIRLAAVALSATALLAACQKSSDPSGDVAAGPARVDAERIVIEDGAFGPGTFELSPGEEVVIEVTNNDDTAHDFAIDALDMNTGTIEPGGIATARFTVPEGSTKFRCTFHKDMEGGIESQ